jgi:fatty acid desaturase
MQPTNKISRRGAERKLRAVEMQRDTAIRMMRLWVYVALAACLTLVFIHWVWGLIYVVLFILCTVITSMRMRRAAEESAAL